MKKWTKLVLAAVALFLAACHKSGGGSGGGSSYLDSLTVGK